MKFTFKHFVELTGGPLEQIGVALCSLALSVRSVAEIYGHKNGFRKPPAPRGSFSLATAEGLEMGFALHARLPQLDPNAPASLDYCAGGIIKWTKDGVAQPDILTERDQVDVNYDATDPNSPLAAFKSDLGQSVGGSFDTRDRSGNVSGQPIVVAPFIVTDNQLPPSPTGEFELGTGQEVD